MWQYSACSYRVPGARRLAGRTGSARQPGLLVLVVLVLCLHTYVYKARARSASAAVCEYSCSVLVRRTSISAHEMGVQASDDTSRTQGEKTRLRLARALQFPPALSTRAETRVWRATVGRRTRTRTRMPFPHRREGSAIGSRSWQDVGGPRPMSDADIGPDLQGAVASVAWRLDQSLVQYPTLWLRTMPGMGARGR